MEPCPTNPLYIIQLNGKHSDCISLCQLFLWGMPTYWKCVILPIGDEPTYLAKPTPIILLTDHYYSSRYIARNFNTYTSGVPKI